MTTSSPITADLDAWLADTLGGAGNGNGKQMGVGMGTSSWAWENRFAVRFPRPDTFMASIPSAAQISSMPIHIRASSAQFGLGSGVKFYLERATGTFTEHVVVAGQDGVPAGANISAYVVSAGPTSGEYPGPTTTTTGRAEYLGTPSANDWIQVEARDLGRWWWARPAGTPLILVAKASDGSGGYAETTTARRFTAFTRESGSPEYLQIIAGGNSPPDKPAPMSVTYGDDGTSFTLTGHYSDPDGDTSTKFEAIFEPD